MYDLIQGASFALFLCAFTLIGPLFGISRIKAFILGICSMIADLLLIKFLTWMENGFQNFGAENMIRVYVFLPAVFYVMAKIAKANLNNFLDAHAMVGPLVYGTGHFACVFAGCCHGYAYYDGTVMYRIAHALTGTNMLPLQIMESVSALLIFMVICIVSIKNKHQTNGKLFCGWYIAFGTSRFFWEFLRDNPKVLILREMTQADGYIGISSLAIWAALMAAVGFALISVIRGEERRKANE